MEVDLRCSVPAPRRAHGAHGRLPHSVELKLKLDVSLVNVVVIDSASTSGPVKRILCSGVTAVDVVE